jgi:Carboxypeptidase regulatory-like domain
MLEPGCTVSGVVVNRRGDPVSCAFVRVPGFEYPDEGLTSLTDREGRFQFRNVPPGGRIVLVESQHLAAAWSQVVADPRRPVQNQFVLQPGDALAGKVVDSDGKPVASATVNCALVIPSDAVAQGELNLAVSAFTAADGTFRLAPVPPGELLLKAFGTHDTYGELRVANSSREVVITVRNPEPPPRPR